MSNNESFIDEVTEELQRDRLYGYFRKYGWIAVLAVILIVGGATYNEIRKSQIASKAQAAGDVLINGLEADDPAVRQIALEEAVASEGGGGLVAQFLLAAEQANAGDDEAALATYTAISSNSEASKIYQDLAALKAIRLQGANLSTAQRRTELEALAGPGAPFRLLAEEELAFVELADNNTEAALERLQAIALDAGVTQGLRRRVSQAIVALGGELDLSAGQ
ncbi:MAG: hypothetical protein AAGD04_14725 [Pseudomonadota bacterium]